VGIHEREVETVSEGLTDRLTGFGTRLGLMIDLAEAVSPFSFPRTLACFDLGGLHEYGALYGSVEVDALLPRLAARFSAALGHAACYRPRDDEFAALLDDSLAASEPRLLAAAEALTVRFGQFGIAFAFGAAVVPTEADDPVEAIALADSRLFQHARGRPERERRGAERRGELRGS
jgi:GGDEF domain-containing protein